MRLRKWRAIWGASMIPLMTDVVSFRVTAAVAGVALVVGVAFGAAMFTSSLPDAPVRAEFCAAELSTIKALEEHVHQLRQMHTQMTERVLRCESAPADCSSSVARALAEQARLRCAICTSRGK